MTPYQAAAVFQKKSRGLLVGNYVILDKIGQGGMGMVFKCRHRRRGGRCSEDSAAIFARDHQAVMRFRREVEAAGRLKASQRRRRRRRRRRPGRPFPGDGFRRGP